jgi:hypothetical protein
MTQFTDSPGSPALNSQADAALNRRLFWTMATIVLLATLVSLVIAPWRVSTGIALGGSLSLFNFHWMRGSIAAAFSVAYSGKKPSIGVAHYLLRYVVVTLVVFVGYMFDIVSLPATILGLCSFVPSLFAEAIRQFYFAIIHREEVG